VSVGTSMDFCAWAFAPRKNKIKKNGTNKKFFTV